MKLLLLTLAISFCGLCELFACYQRPDKLSYASENLLINRFTTENDTPIDTYYKKYPHKEPKWQIMDTGCNRGYIAEYSIKDNKLYLESVGTEKSKYPASMIMGYDCEYPIFCDWFSTNNLKLVRQRLSDYEYKISVKNGIVKIEKNKVEIREQSKNLKEKNHQKKEYIDINSIDVKTLNFDLADNGALYISRGNPKSFSSAKRESFKDGTNIESIQALEDKYSFRITIYIFPRTINGKTDFVVYLAGKEIWRYSQNIGKCPIFDFMKANDKTKINTAFALIKKDTSNIKSAQKAIDELSKYDLHTNANNAVYKIKLLLDFTGEAPLTSYQIYDRMWILGKGLDKESEIKLMKQIEKSSGRVIPFANISDKEYEDDETRKRIKLETWDIVRMKADIYNIISAKNFDSISKESIKQNIIALSKYLNFAKKYFPQNYEKISNALFEYLKNLTPKERQYSKFDMSLFERAKDSNNWDEKILYASMLSATLEDSIEQDKIEKSRGNKDAFDEILTRLYKNRNSPKYKIEEE